MEPTFILNKRIDPKKANIMYYYVENKWAYEYRSRGIYNEQLGLDPQESTMRATMP